MNATERDHAILTRHLGLDKPLPVQYAIYVKNIFLGDFGSSVLTRRPVTEHIWERLPATVELGSGSSPDIAAASPTRSSCGWPTSDCRCPSSSSPW